MDRKEIIVSLENLGLNLLPVEDDYEVEIPDSMSFISTIVSLENEYDIEFPDTILNYELFVSVNHLKEVIEELQEQQNAVAV